MFINDTNIQNSLKIMKIIQSKKLRSNQNISKSIINSPSSPSRVNPNSNSLNNFINDYKIWLVREYHTSHPDFYPIHAVYWNTFIKPNGPLALLYSHDIFKVSWRRGKNLSEYIAPRAFNWDPDEDDIPFRMKLLKSIPKSSLYEEDEKISIINKRMMYISQISK